MPRRRTTAPKKRPHPKLEDGHIDENINPDDRTVKVDLLLRDFDNGVEMRIKRIETAHRNLISKLTRQFHVERKTFTKDTLNMKVSDFLMSLGNEENDTEPLESSDSESEADIMDQDEDEDADKIMQTIHKKRNRRNVFGVGVINEESTTKTTGTTRKRTLATRNMPPPTASRNKFQTPFQGFSRSRAGWETPMVTPKFDPRLPVTTARKPRRGESTISTVFMSAKGSPIHTSQPLLTIPTANNPNQGISFLGSENIDTIKEAFDSFDPQMKENFRKMAKMMALLTDHK